ncbi:MAG: hypothetical protein E7214_14430 [Clostridium sp.]|nr:hypothetical protein [Clostridium sp.]
MEVKSPSFGVGVTGKVCNQKFNGAISNKDGSIELIGGITIDSLGFNNIMPVVNKNLSEFISNECSEIFGDIKGKALFYHYKDKNLIQLTTQEISVLALNKSNDSLLVFNLDVSKSHEGKGILQKLISFVSNIAKYLGIEDFMLMVHVGNSSNIKGLIDEIPLNSKNSLMQNSVLKNAPSIVNNYDLILGSKFVFEGKDSAFTKAMSKLLGIKSLDFFVGAKKDFSSYMAILNLPNVDNKVLAIKNSYIKISGDGKIPSLNLRGNLSLKCLKDINFIISSDISMDKFLLSAEVSNNKAKLSGPFNIGDAALLIGYNNGLTFGILGTIYIRDLSFFAAVVLDYNGAVVVPKLLSAAIDELSLTSLVKNFTGINVSGLEDFDQIAIESFDFELGNNFPVNILDNVEEVVKYFNKTVSDKNLCLSVDDTKITRVNKGVSLVDKSRMRHYFIDNSGKLKLKAQFYNSMSPEEYSFGSYRVAPGMFICGRLKLFNVHLKLYFALSEKDGLVTFMQIDPMRFGLFSFANSSFSTNVTSKNSLPSNSIIHQFISPNVKGPTAFLALNRRDLNFYLDGRLSYASIFNVDTRIVISRKLISIAARFEIFKLFKCAFMLNTDISSANNLNFDVVLSIDLTGIEKLFKSVTDSIERAITTYRNGINSAQRAINEAKNKVNSLQSQINSLNRKIEECKQDTRRARGFRKAIRAIKNAAKIAGYEVAKAALYVSIGVARAALEVASKAVKIAGKVGEAVLVAVNNIIKGVLKLFYIKKFELRASANSRSQSFMVNLEFNALGKDHKISKSYSHGSLNNSAVSLLSSDMNSLVKPDIDAINNNTYRSNKSKFQPDNIPLAVHKQRLADGLEEVKSSRSLLESMAKEYVAEFGQPLDITEEMSVEFCTVMDSVTSNLDLAKDMINVDDVKSIIDNVSEEMKNKDSVYRDDELKTMEDVVTGFNEVLTLRRDIDRGREILTVHRDEFENNNKTMVEELRNVVPYEVDNVEDKCNMGRVLDKVEDKMLTEFQSDRSNYYINFAKESELFKALDEERELYGYTAQDELLNRRAKVKKNGYQERL